MSPASFWKMFGMDPGERRGDDDATETVRKIAHELEGLDPARARFVAAFAYILTRVAHADLDISENETRVMERAVRDLARLSEAEAALVVVIAKNQTLLFGSTENYLVTREFNAMAAPEEKQGLIECLFAVSAADESVSSVEEREIRRIATELDLTHEDFIAARVRYREYIPSLRPGLEGTGA